jgi:hypothetical protein
LAGLLNKEKGGFLGTRLEEFCGLWRPHPGPASWHFTAPVVSASQTGEGMVIGFAIRLNRSIKGL